MKKVDNDRPLVLINYFFKIKHFLIKVTIRNSKLIFFKTEEFNISNIINAQLLNCQKQKSAALQIHTAKKKTLKNGHAHKYQDLQLQSLACASYSSEKQEARGDDELVF